MNTASSPVRRPIAWLLAIGCIAITLHAVRGAPPIKHVFEECAVEQLAWNEPAATYDVGCRDTPWAVGGDTGCALGVDDTCSLGGHRAACTGPSCGRDVCCPTVEEVTQEKTCWNVQCEKVCIPAVRLPWEPGGSKLTLFSWLCGRGTTNSCGDGVCSESCTDGTDPAGCCYPAKCGKVRYIRMLEPDSYEVTKCQCKWEIRRLPCCCGAEGCAHGCAGTVDAPAYEVDSTINGVLPMP